MKKAARISRYILILLIIFISAIIIPKYYWLMFAKNVKAPMVYYSSIKKQFLVTKVENKKYVREDAEGHVLTRKQFERLTPLFSFRQLIFRDEMPDTVDGMPMDYKQLKRNYIYLSLRPDDIYYYNIDLYPLIEARPDGPELQIPNEFFRIKNRFEFIDCETNKILPKLSARFNRALIKAGFTFPAVKYFGNPTNMKPFDDGYFVLDSKGKLFHLMRIHNRPYVKEVSIPDDIKIEYILVKELELKEFHGLLVSKDNRLFIISRDHYKIIPLPSKGYDRKTMKVKIMGNLKYRIISLVAKDSIIAYVTDRQYNLIDTYKSKWTSNIKSPAGKVLSVVTPFSLKTTSKNSEFIDFYFSFHSWYAIIFNLLLVALTVYLLKKYQGREIKSQLIDLLVVLVTGVYGLLAVLLIREES